MWNRSSSSAQNWPWHSRMAIRSWVRTYWWRKDHSCCAFWIQGICNLRNCWSWRPCKAEASSQFWSSGKTIDGTIHSPTSNFETLRGGEATWSISMAGWVHSAVGETRTSWSTGKTGDALLGITSRVINCPTSMTWSKSRTRLFIVMHAMPNSPTSLIWAWTSSRIVAPHLGWNLNGASVNPLKMTVHESTQRHPTVSVSSTMAGKSKIGVSSSSCIAILSGTVWQLASFARISESKTAAMLIVPSILPSHFGGKRSSARDSCLNSSQKAIISSSFGSKITSSSVGHTRRHRINSQDLYACNWAPGLKVGMCFMASMRSRMELRIHNACAGHASCPAADKVSRTSVPKSITGSNVFNPITSFGCRWRITLDPSGKMALRTKQPWRPLLSNRAWVKPNCRQPQGQALFWDPHACKAHGVFVFPLRRYFACNSSLTPNACISAMSRARLSSSSWAQSRTRGITCWTCCTFWNIGHWFNSIGPKSGAEMIHHARCRRHGHMWSSLSSTWRQWKPVHLTKWFNSPFTKASWAAGETHSSTISWAWSKNAVRSVFVRQFDLKSSLLRSSPNLEKGWRSWNQRWLWQHLLSFAKFGIEHHHCQCRRKSNGHHKLLSKGQASFDSGQPLLGSRTPRQWCLVLNPQNLNTDPL